MPIAAADVEKVALLSRLMLTREELEGLTGDLVEIVNYVDHLGEVDTDDVEPLFHPLELRNVSKEDEVAPSLPREEALANAPKHNDEGYLVPAVLGE